MRPFIGKVLSNKKRIFNYKLSRTRRNVESALGLLSNKWKLFHRPFTNLHLSTLLIKIRFLHNYTRVRDGLNIQVFMSVTGFVEIEQDSSATTRAPNQYIQTRNNLTDYFCSDVGRQNKYI